MNLLVSTLCNLHLAGADRTKQTFQNQDSSSKEKAPEPFSDSMLRLLHEFRQLCQPMIRWPLTATSTKHLPQAVPLRNKCVNADAAGCSLPTDPGTVVIKRTIVRMLQQLHVANAKETLSPHLDSVGLCGSRLLVAASDFSISQQLIFWCTHWRQLCEQIAAFATVSGRSM